MNHQNNTNQNNIVAAFDFDGTLTYYDSLFPFLLFTDGYLKTITNILMILPNLIGYALKLSSRQATKEAMLTRSLGGRSINNIRENANEFASTEIPKLLRPEAMEKLQWHLSQKHRCIIVSATLDDYLIPWAKKIGVQDVVSSKLEVNGNGTVTGKLSGLNCWGPEKPRRLTELLGPRENYTLYAYGDSRGDKELLEFADYPFYRKWK